MCSVIIRTSDFFVGNVLIYFSIPQVSHTRFGRPVHYVRTQLVGYRPCLSPHTFRMNLSGPFDWNGYSPMRPYCSGLLDGLWKVKIKNDINIHCGLETGYRQGTNVLLTIYRPNLQNTGSCERTKKRTYASYR